MSALRSATTPQRVPTGGHPTARRRWAHRADSRTRPWRGREPPCGCAFSASGTGWRTWNCWSSRPSSGRAGRAPPRASSTRSCPRPAGRCRGPAAAGQLLGGAGLAAHRGWPARGLVAGRRLCWRKPAPGSGAGCSPRLPRPARRQRYHPPGAAHIAQPHPTKMRLRPLLRLAKIRRNTHARKLPTTHKKSAGLPAGAF